MKNSPLKDQPEMQQAVEQSKRLLSNPSGRTLTIWILWSALLLMIGYGLWTAYAAFHGRSYAIGCVLIGCLLFLARQTIFHRTPYEWLFRSPEKLQLLLVSEHYPIALSIIWHHFIVATFFFVVAIFSSIQLRRRWSNKSQPA